MRKNGKHSGKAAIAAHQNIAERDYWLKQLSGQWTRTRFLSDYKDPGPEQRKPEILDFKFPGPLSSQVIKMSRAADHALHMILETGIVLLLYKYTGRSDILTGTPVYKQDIDPSLLINTVLVLRNHVAGELCFKDLLLQMKETIVRGTEHYRYPLEFLKEQLNITFPAGDFPFFEIAVLLLPLHDKTYLQHLPLSVIFTFSRAGQDLGCTVEYNASRYSRQRIQRIIRHFFHLLGQALTNPDLPAARLSPLSILEKQQVLEAFNDTAGEYPRDKTLNQLFTQQVEQTPDHTALVGPGLRAAFPGSPTGYITCMTYSELNRKSNRLAGYLRVRGLGTDSIAAIMMEPSIEMITAILGILKAGGAYLPIDPLAPGKRVESMLEDGSVTSLLTSGKCMGNRLFVSLRGFNGRQLQPYLTASRVQVEDLDYLQFPNRALIDYEKYRPYIGQAMVKNSITIHMSRGCAYNCAYCFKIWPRKYVIRSAENVFEEINLYYRMGVRRFAFVDDLPNINIKESSKLFRLIISNGLKVHLHFPNGIRGDILTREYIDLMVEAGTITMDLALETTSPRLQKLVRKNLNLKALEENIRYITENYPQVILELQILHGIPTETEEEARDSLEFIKRIKWVHFPYIHVMNIYPNSDMARIAQEHGISREAIEQSADLAYHELPQTLPFPESFTRKYQAEFLNEYFMSRERLLNVLPQQMKVLTEDELVQKYNSYLPVEIDSFAGLLDYAGIAQDEIKGEFLPADYGVVPGFNLKLSEYFPRVVPQDDALRVLLLDLSQYFTHHTRIRYDVVEPPLGLLYVLTHLQRKYGSQINGKIAKSRIDFDSFEQLKQLIDDFNPHVIGLRTLNFYKDFFHETAAFIKQWKPGIPIIAGGPYATSNYHLLLKDNDIDVVVVGEGEVTFAELVGKMLENNNNLPDQAVLKQIPGLAFIDEKENPGSTGVREVILMDRLPAPVHQESVKYPETVNRSSDLAYIIYTSGSTGNPKGVMIEHDNVVNQLSGLVKRFHLDRRMNYILLAAYTFDVSVMHIFLPLITGAKVHLLDEETRKDSLKLWRYVSEKQVDILNIVPAYMKILLENIKPGQVRLKYLFVGGDVLDIGLYRALTETFTVQQIINIYGPTETTINAALYPCNPVETGSSIPIGKPLMNYRAYILSGDLQPVPIGVGGELFLAGEGLARGYLNKAGLTLERFINYKLTNKKLLWKMAGPGGETTRFLEKSPPGRRRQRQYKTGDFARWLESGDIEFLGRIDRQVKVRGFRIEPGEIERHLLSYRQIKEAMVVAREDRNGDKYLCAYLVPGLMDSCSDISLGAVKEWLLARLPHYMVPAYFVLVEKIPVTSFGKPDMKALPDPVVRQTGTGYVAPRNQLEKDLVEVWSEVMAVDRSRIGIDTNFFDLGGHSLKATILISRTHKKLHVRIPLVELFKNPTIRGLSQYIGGADQETYAAVEPVEEREYYPLSSAQKRLYILEQITPGTIAYNMPNVFIIQEPVDRERLEHSCRRLIRRHESLRTSFMTIEKEPVQRVHEEVEFFLDYYVLDGEENYKLQISNEKEAGDHQTLKNRIIEDFIRPFDLSCAPLLRMGLIDMGEGKGILMVDLHHIITDGTSQEILTYELLELYSGQELPLLQHQYKDYARWQCGAARQAELKQQEDWWINQFRDEVPLLELPIDHPRPVTQSFEGDWLIFSIDERETHALKTLAAQENVTLFMVLLAIFYVFLSRISGKEDMVVGTPVSGRRHIDLRPLVGMFVNTLALRGQPRGEMDFRHFLQQVREHTLQAFENQEYPFEDLVERLSLARDTARNPLFDVVFTLYNIQVALSPGRSLLKNLKSYGYRSKISKFDITFSGAEISDELVFIVEYSSQLFKNETVPGLVAYFRNVVSDVLAEPGRRLSEIEIIAEEEKRKVLYDFNDTATDYPGTKTIQELFAEQAEQMPDRMVLSGMIELEQADMKQGGAGTRGINTLSITYRHLDEKSGQLATVLMQKGVGPDVIVGILLERSVEQVIGILGILKAGGAYMPIDPDYPIERQQYMLKDGNVKFLVKKSNNFSNPITSETIETFHIDDLVGSLFDTTSALPRLVPVSVDSLAYIMYTSGSTGGARGVMVTHRNVVRLVRSAVTNQTLLQGVQGDGFLEKSPPGRRRQDSNFIELNLETRILQTGAPVFDAVTFEMWGSLLNGGLLVLVANSVILDASRLGEVLVGVAVNTLWLTSGLFNRLVQESILLFSPLRYLLVGGDVLSPVHINRVKRRFPGLSIINGYGPTENTTFSTTYLIRDEIEGSVPIGSPIPNSTAYIISNYGHIQPAGIWGELYVGGDGVSRGYLNRPELTAERFISFQGFQRVYKTGDLVRWLEDGNIEFSGRMDQQVKIRGYRIEPGEIETHLLAHGGVREAVVIAGESEAGDRYLCAYVVSAVAGLSGKELKEYLLKSQPDYMVPSFFVFLEKIPLTVNGKIDRRKLPEPVVSGEEIYLAPRDELERRLVRVWETVLFGEIRGIIGRDTDFFEIGGHSLKAVTLIAEIHRDFEVKIPLADFFKNPSIRSMARYIREAEKHEFIGLGNVEKREYYPLSYNQKRLYFIHEMDRQSGAYNMPVRLTLGSGTSRELVERVLRQLMQRHESLRTYMKMIGDEPVQIIEPMQRVPLPMSFIDLSAVAAEERRKKREEVYSDFAGAPFDLGTVPLIKALLLKTDTDRYEVIFNLHHIISDGWSLNVLEQEFYWLYRHYVEGAGESTGVEPGELEFQYKNYARWHNGLLADEERVSRARIFWETQLSGNLPVLVLPYDGRPLAGGSKASASFGLLIPASLTGRLRQVARQWQASLFMVLLAGFNLLLSRVTGQPDIMMAIPAAARQHESLKNIIGMFVNTLILRNTIDTGESFSDFFKGFQAGILQVLEYQSYPMELICSQLKIKYPEIQVFFNMINIGDAFQDARDHFQGGHLDNVQEAKFELVCYLMEYTDGIGVSCHYHKNLFMPETIEKIMHLYQRVLAEIADNPERKIEEFSLAGKGRETRKLLRRGNGE